MRDLEKDFLSNQKRLSQIMNYYHKNNILLEIISCNEKIKDGKHERFGRFIFEKEKHEVMLNREGYYFLVVKNGFGIVNAKLIPASVIGNRKLVSWVEFFN